MGDSGGKIWIQEAREYERLCRRVRRFTLGFVGPVLAFLGLLSLDRAALFPVICFLFVLGLPITCICMLGCAFAQHDLMNFRCPRCGGRFVMGRRRGWPTDLCKHCGLDLGSMAKAAEKPPSMMDPLE